MNTQNIRKIDAAATFACIGALLCWSVGPVFIKLLTGCLDLWTQNLLRYLVACLFWLPFLALAFKTGRLDNRVWRKALLPLAPNLVMQSLWAGAFYYIEPAFMNLLTQSSIIWIAGFSLIFFADERVLVKSKRFWLGMALSIIGVVGVMVCKENFAAAKTMTGIGIALAAAVMWGIYAVCARIAFRDIDSRIGFSVISIYTTSGLFVLAVLFGRIQDCLYIPTQSWVYIVVSGVLAIAFSHVLYYAAIRRIGATIPSLVLLSTPFTVLAISRLVFGESLNSFQWLFGMILISGSALAIWAQQHLK